MIARLALRQTLNQWRRGDWRALLSAVFLMTSLMTLLSLTGERLQKSLVVRSAELLGADLILSSSRPLADEQLESITQQTQQSGLTLTQVTQFASMVEQNEHLLLASIRAVASPYPLRGKIITQPAHSAPDLPSPGQLWAEQAVLDRLNAQLGDTLNIGYSSLKIAALIESSPDRGSGFASFNPQIIMRTDDLAATGVLAPGSRAKYRLLAAGPATAINQLEQSIRADLPKWQRLYLASGDQPASRNALTNAGRYLKLSALFALLMGTFAIYLGLRRYSQSQQKRTALLMSLGLSRQQLQQLFGIQLLLGWLVSALPGLLLGWALHKLLLGLLGNLLPAPLPDVSLPALFGSMLVAGVIMLLVGFWTLMPLANTSVLNLIRANSKLPARSPLAWLIPPALFSLVALFVESLPLAVLLTLGLGAGVLLAGSATQQLIQLLYRLLFARQPLAALLQLRLRQQSHWHRVQGGVLSILLTLLASLIFIRNDLVNQWQAQLPDNTPSQFAINIQPWEKEAFQTWLANNQITADLYPMIRARVTHLNGAELKSQLSPEQLQHNSLNRELNLTWGNRLPAHNTLLEGQWSNQAQSISVEKSMAENLGLKLGDRIGFQAGSNQFEGVVTSIREVVWSSFQPNFYVIFSPGVIEALPATYITSFQLKAHQKTTTRALLKTFPTVTLIDIEQMLEQARGMIERLGDSASLILALTILSALVLIVTTLQQDLARRQQEGALLRTLGTSARRYHQLSQQEYLLAGISCGLVAAVLTELLLAGVYHFLVKLPLALHPWLWLLMPVLACALFVLTGQLTRQTLPLSQSYARLKQET